MEKKTIIIIIAGLLIASLAGYWHGIRSGTDVPDIGKRADEVREQFNAVEQQRQDIGREIDSSRTSLREGRQQLIESQSINRTNGEIIADCQSVLRRIRERGPVSN